MAEPTPKLAACRPSARTVTAWTILFMVLLRVAIGWHFLYEGIWKVEHFNQFSSTPYLVASVGPFRDIFRGMVDDIDGLERLTVESIQQRVDDRYELLVEKYNLTDQQKASTAAVRDNMQQKAENLITSDDFQNNITAYKALLHQIRIQEEAKGGPDYGTERLTFDNVKRNQMRNNLLARVEKPLTDMQNYTLGQLNPEQLTAGPPPRLQKSQTYAIDLMTIGGLLVVGTCLILGLFTRLAALGTLCFLAMFYFSMPPWPGLPESPVAEGHYLIVNKNLIEMIAVLMIATSRVGRWAGLDAYICAWRDRGKRRAAMSAPAYV